MGTKKCKSCNLIKPLNSFYKKKRKSSHFIESECKDCRKLRIDINFKLKVIPETKKCKDCGAIKKASKFKPRKSNKDGLENSCYSCRYIKQKDNYRKWGKTYYKKNSEVVIKRVDEWRKNNRPKVNMIEAKRRAKISNSRINKFDYEDILERDGLWCYLGGHPIEGKYEFDHIDPLSKRGQHSEDNISITCPHHNNSKGSKTLLEYLLHTKDS